MASITGRCWRPGSNRPLLATWLARKRIVDQLDVSEASVVGRRLGPVDRNESGHG